MLKEHTPVWVWDGSWWPAHVVLPTVDLENDVMLVRFENGVTAPIKASAVRYRGPAHPNPPSNDRRLVPEQLRTSLQHSRSSVRHASASATAKSNRHSI